MLTPSQLRFSAVAESTYGAKERDLSTWPQNVLRPGGKLTGADCGTVMHILVASPRLEVARPAIRLPEPLETK
jgi:hypothetical protein